MNQHMQSANARSKTHPATRAVEPDDPMNLFGYEVPGDPQFMLQVLVEEYARLGYDVDALMSLARNPFYQGVHGLLQLFGEDELRWRVTDVLAHCGVMRVSTRQATPLPEQLVPLQRPEGELRRTNDV